MRNKVQVKNRDEERSGSLGVALYNLPYRQPCFA